MTSALHNRDACPETTKRPASARLERSARGTTRAGVRQRHTSGGHAKRLQAAFASLDTFPALLESRNRVLAACAAEHAAIAEIVAAVEADIALTIAVLRVANTEASAARRRVRPDNVVAAVEALSAQTLRATASALPTFDFFDHAGVWASAPAQMRLHALATQRAADQIAAMVGYDKRDRLAVTSLLHDIGKLVLARAYPGYPGEIHSGARTLEERVQFERRELGVDHATIGSVLIERWGLPTALVEPIERHHAPDATGEAAIVRLADMIARYSQGVRVSPGEMLHCVRSVGLDADDLRALLHDQQGPCTRRQEALRDCPLTERELGLLKRLADGSVYKQIAHELELSVSTVRTHLHNIYGKLGVLNRAQAVLTASEAGWL
jgi:putative nucleotidyltransferase with HDIG domain